jgi:hypothetical protein
MTPIWTQTPDPQTCSIAPNHSVSSTSEMLFWMMLNPNYESNSV